MVKGSFLLWLLAEVDRRCEAWDRMVLHASQRHLHPDKIVGSRQKIASVADPTHNPLLPRQGVHDEFPFLFLFSRRPNDKDKSHCWHQQQTANHHRQEPRLAIIITIEQKES